MTLHFKAANIYVMEKNVGFLDRVFRFLLGIVFMTWAIAGGPYWTWLGVIFLATAAWASCPIYRALGISSRRQKD